jgi:hypothetical protein
VRSRLAPFAALLPLLALACGAPEPVAELTVEPTAIVLPYPRFVPLRLVWQPTAELDGVEGQLYVFVHLLDEPGNVLRTFDHPFPGAWRPGEKIADEILLYQSALGAPLPAGEYPLSVGIYDGAGHRWQLRTPGREVDRAEYAVATVRVPADVDTTPRVRFSSNWRAPESGADRQILNRRALAGEGTIRFDDLPASAEIWLGLRVPDARELKGELLLDPGATTPTVEVTTSCGPAAASLSGPGPHDVRLLVAPAPGEGCDVRLAPNFRVRLPEGYDRSVVLETLAWAVPEAPPASG